VTAASGFVVIGADTHLNTIHLAALTDTGKALGDKEFRTTPAGYKAALKWATTWGTVIAAGVEGTSSYGAGLTAAFTAAGIEVCEVTRPERASRRNKGKSDPLDAYSAARAALSRDRVAVPKDPRTTALKALHTAYKGAVKARVAATVQITSLLVTAPIPLRERYRHLSAKALVRTMAAADPDIESDPVAAEVLVSMILLAQRIGFLAAQEHDLTTRIDAVVTAMNPALRAAYGVGPITAAQLLITAGANPERIGSSAAFAALTGVAPVEASSGKITRHRLSRGGDRGANHALHRIALVRMATDQRTRAYVREQTAKKRSKKEILRLLKRAIAREMFRLLTRVCAFDDYADLRPTRQAKNITLTTVANHFGTGAITISRLERGQHRNHELATAYRQWLTAA
jgi:transposase